MAAHCFVRASCFGISSVLFVESYKQDNGITALNKFGDHVPLPLIPKTLIMLIICPDYFINFAYLNLVW